MSHIEQLVGRQIELCEIRRRLEAEHRPSASGPAEEPLHGPCLLISRQHGSLGSELAGLLGERLDWKVFDRELVEAIAQRAHVRNQLIESIDASVRSRWRFPPERRLQGHEIGWREYLYHLHQVLLALGHHGSSVIVGRGANYVLPADRCVRIRVVASLNDRVRRIAERAQVPLAEAQGIVETTELERSAFVQRAFGHDPSSPLDYDLVVNTGEVPVEVAARLVLLLVQEKLGVEIPAAAWAAG